jgi:hypothetical protein
MAYNADDTVPVIKNTEQVMTERCALWKAQQQNSRDLEMNKRRAHGFIMRNLNSMKRKVPTFRAEDPNCVFTVFIKEKLETEPGKCTFHDLSITSKAMPAGYQHPTV